MVRSHCQVDNYTDWKNQVICSSPSIDKKNMSHLISHTLPLLGVSWQLWTFSIAQIIRCNISNVPKCKQHFCNYMLVCFFRLGHHCRSICKSLSINPPTINTNCSKLWGSQHMSVLLIFLLACWSTDISYKWSKRHGFKYSSLMGKKSILNWLNTSVVPLYFGRWIYFYDCYSIHYCTVEVRHF